MAETEIVTRKVMVGLHNIAAEIHAGLRENLVTDGRRTAVYFSSNKLAVAGLSYFIKENIRVPEDVSVIAFDETEAYTLFPTEIDFVKQPLKEMARASVKLLDDQINGNPSGTERTVFTAELIHKKSVR